jgi:two-component system sensor histidine kinase CpxA
MTLSIARSLGARILALAALNLALLAGLALVASGVRVPRSAADLLLQASAGRILDVSRQVALDLERSPAQQAATVLAAYEARYRAAFVLATNDGAHMAGAPVELPPAVIRHIRAASPGDGRSRPPPPPRPGPRRGDDGPPLPQAPPFLVRLGEGAAYWIGVRIPIQYAESTEITPGTLLIVTRSLTTTPLLFPTQWMVWALAALGLTVACWWPLLRGITTSVRQMERATARIAEGKFDADLRVNRRDELGRLARSIGQMSSRLDALVTGQKRFLGDTSHELRSPLGRLRVALELVEREASDSARRHVEDAKADVEAMIGLTDDLLHYARASLFAPETRREQVPLAPIIETAVAREARNRPNVHVSVPPGLVVEGDAALLERAIANVIRNAVQHGDTGRIAVSAARHDRRVELTIADEGPGVPAESLPRLFEPFYRVDAARTRGADATGLGLAIVRSAVEACGGSVTAERGTPRGLSVRFTLPTAS